LRFLAIVVEQSPVRRNGGGAKTAIFTPPWWADTAAAKNGSILQVHHPEHGWLAFVVPPEHAAVLGAALLRHSGVCDSYAGTLPPTTMTVN
jgi:hypothetical protein